MLYTTARPISPIIGAERTMTLRHPAVRTVPKRREHCVARGMKSTKTLFSAEAHKSIAAAHQRAFTLLKVAEALVVLQILRRQSTQRGEV